MGKHDPYRAKRYYAQALANEDWSNLPPRQRHLIWRAIEYLNAPMAGETVPIGHVAAWCYDNPPSVFYRSRITDEHQARITAAIWQTQSPNSGPMMVQAVYGNVVTPTEPVEFPGRAKPVGNVEEAADLWKLVDGDMRDHGAGTITYHIDAFRQGFELGRAQKELEDAGNSDPA